MVAGATGIDLFLLVVDAAEGARPQTHEHLAILRLLGVERGVVAVTKADAVDVGDARAGRGGGARARPGRRRRRGERRHGSGDRRAARGTRVASRTDDASTRADCATRLYVDRVFTLRGIGTVVTGTLWSGAIGEGDQLRLEPSGRDVRVRSVQVHDAAVERARGGPACRRQPAGDRARARSTAATRSSRRARFRARIGSRSRSSELEPIADGDAALRPPRHRAGSRRASCASGTTTPSCAWQRRSSPRAATASSSGSETTVGGAVRARPVAAATASTAERDRLLERGRSRVDRSRARPRAGGLEALAARALLGRRRARGRARRRACRRTAGRSRTTWLEETGALVEERLRSRAETSPLDPGVPLAELLPTEPWAAAVLRASSRRAPRSEGVPAGRRRLARRREPTPRPSWRPRSTPPDSRRRRSTIRSSPGSSRRRAASSGSATASPSPPGRTRSRGTSSRARRPRRVRSRSRASATWRASAAATRSSCSSAWT